MTSQRNTLAGAEYSDATEDDVEAVTSSSAFLFDSSINIIPSTCSILQ
ncbi:MAG: hypothetical protein WC333_05990 [Dehalococcoidia bacterium]